MGLLNPTNTTPAQQAAQQIRQAAQQSYQQLAQAGQRGWNLLWKNPLAKPADIIAALGTDAKAIFALANLNITTLSAAAGIGGVAAPAIPGVPAGYTVTFNPEGSATLAGNATH